MNLLSLILAIPAGVRELHAHPLDGARVHWTRAKTPSRLPEGEGISNF